MAANARTVLVVDDDPEIVSMLSARLAGRGYRILTAADGLEAIAEAKRSRPELIVLDVMMPHKTGWEVARALKQDPVTEGIKIVMLTAIGEQMNEMTSPLYGADAYFDKPFDFGALETKIAELLA
ncbi:MAG: response regulator [Kofleriaceae bacterium]|nr:MAG: response regulator [Kofleriaceae bacterium]MBZ0238606.1 response regulator [Kofleriaceae bacterium]